jgi:selenium metabolism protein YedF
VVLARKAFLESPGETFLVLVDNQGAKDNVLKLTQSLGGSSEVEQSEGEFRIYVRPDAARSGSEGAAASTVNPSGIIYGGSAAFQSVSGLPSPVASQTAVLLKSAGLGEGSEALGRVLMKSLLYTLRESPEGIGTIICLNSAVYLTCEGSEVLEHLEFLENEGVEILSCGTCLDYYNLKNSLKVGSISNMYNILEVLQRAGKVLAF